MPVFYSRGGRGYCRPSLLVCLSLLLLLPACRPLRSLGKNPSGEELAYISTLPNYVNGAFRNPDVFPVDSNAVAARKPRWTRLLKYLVNRKAPPLIPLQPLPVAATNLHQNTYGAPTVIWFGHSSFLLKTATANLLFDPDFSNYAGPLRGLVKAFAGTSVYRVSDLPVIDALVISHDHYDHLDYRTVKQLKKKVKRVIVPVGVGSHFRKWGYPAAIITELNWGDSARINGEVTVIATPAHHRSNRTLAQNKTLWASFVVMADGYRLYYSGDSGYSSHFARIGQQYGPFDLALLECGQYNTKWPRSHLFPSQTARAATDLRAATLLPVHWARFAESEHPWNEPVKWLLASADSLKLRVSVPFMGQPYTIGQPMPKVAWWKAQ